MGEFFNDPSIHCPKKYSMCEIFPQGWRVRSESYKIQKNTNYPLEREEILLYNR